MDTTEPKSEPADLNDLPTDELVHYGRQLGLVLDRVRDRGQMLELVGRRRELLRQLDRQALLDVVVWGRRPVRESAGKEQLAREIATIRKMDFAGLSDPGLSALAKLRGLTVFATDSRREIEARLRDAEPFWDRVRRTRRSIVGSLVSRIVHENAGGESQDYHFLPEDKTTSTLKQQIVDEGLVGGLARKLRGAADDYVHEKLNEIEARIDRKLDEIDHRLAEWRDREIANRLKIIKITLAASVLVAALSLAYQLLKSRLWS